MANHDKHSHPFLTGAIIGGIVGICATALYAASKKKQKKGNSPLNQIEEVVIRIGEILSTKDMAKVPMAHMVGKKIHEHENVISDVVEVISSGIHLWEKLRKEV